MRDCPTVEGSSIPLIIHRIAASDCQARQGCNYHKCHRCIFRGKPASWSPETPGRRDPGTPGVGERAVPLRKVEVPRPDTGTATPAKPTKAPPKQPRRQPRRPAGMPTPG